MIRTTVPTSVRQGSALIGVAGLLVLAGCASTPADSDGAAPTTGGGAAAVGQPVHTLRCDGPSLTCAMG